MAVPSRLSDTTPRPETLRAGFREARDGALEPVGARSCPDGQQGHGCVRQPALAAHPIVRSVIAELGMAELGMTAAGSVDRRRQQNNALGGRPPRATTAVR